MFTDIEFSTEAEDRFIDFVLDAIENGDMILRVDREGQEAGCSLVTTEKGQRLVERVNAEMN